MVKGKAKKDWTRRGPRNRFLTASVTPKELEQAHIVSRAMGMTVSGMLRQLIANQHYILITGRVYISPIKEPKLDLSEV